MKKSNSLAYHKKFNQLTTLKIFGQMLITLTFIPALLLILLAAAGGRLLSLKLNQPEILGELILGIILGNIILLAPNAQKPVADVAKIGILLLLFLTGLDLDFERFKKSALPASGVAFGGVTLPFALGFFLGTSFGASTLESLFIGVSLVATSVGLSASILQDTGKLQTELGALIIDSAIIDDVIGIIMMTAIFGLASPGGFKIASTLYLIIFSILFFVLSLTLGIKAIKELSKRIRMEKENLLLGGLVILLLFAMITEKMGLAGVIGAFVAGLITGQTGYAQQLSESASLIGRGFFIPIFFVTVGMKFNIGQITSVGLFAIILAAFAIAGKILGCGIAAKLSNYTDKESIGTGIAMVPRAEVALIIAHFGVRNNVFGSEILSAIVIMVIVTTLITPTLLWRVLKET